MSSQKLDPKDTVKDKNGIDKHVNDKFPLTTYMVAGSSAEKKTDNKIYVMKWGEMVKTNKEDEIHSDMDSDDEEKLTKEPNVRFESIPHRGGINRIRSMYGSPIVATWNEDAEVGIYDVTSALEELDKDQTKKQKKQTKVHGGNKLAGFKHKAEGYALDWSPLTFGRLATGSCNAELNLFQATDETCSNFVKETVVGL